MIRRQQMTPAGYVERARAVFKIRRPCDCRPGCPSNDLPSWWAPSIGEYLYDANIEGA